MADWLIRHIPQTTEQFLCVQTHRASEAKNNPGESPCSGHVKQLQYTVRVAEPNPASPTFYWNNSVGLRANWLAACRYFTQGIER